MPTNFNIPFLGGGPSIAEQILQGLHQGAVEQQSQNQLGIEQQNANTNERRATSDVALQGAQTDEIRERIRRQQVLSDMFKPKPDSADTSSTSTSTAPAALRSDFDRVVDESDLPDSLKDSIKYNGHAQAAAGQPVKAFDFLQTVLDKFGRKVSPHILSNGGIPYAVTDRFGEPWELHDPNMPDEMKPLVQSALNVYQQKNILPLADVQNANLANTRRWQVLHPGQPMPADLTLPQNASKDEYTRIEKQFGDLVQLESVKAQRDAANAARNASQNRSDEKFGIEPVIGTDPKTGKDVLVSEADAKAMGLTGTMKADSQDVSKAQSARHWIPLATKTATIQRANQNDPMSPASNPEEMGILQLIDDLDKRGKLGTIASRWNDFMAGNVGSGDPESEALRAKMGLSTTLLMNAHVGSRGGSYMMEHFENLANAGKMDAATLRSGVKSELDYIKDRAMLPSGRSGGHAAPASGGLSPDNPFAPKTNPFAAKPKPKGQ